AETLDESRAGFDREWPVGAHQQEAHATELSRQEREELERRLIGPVQVVDDDDQRGALRGPSQERGARVEQPEAPLVRLDRRQRFQLGHMFPQRRHEPGDLLTARPKLGGERLRLAAGRVGADGLLPGPVRGGPQLLRTRAPYPPARRERHAGDELLDHPRLPDPRITGDGDQPSATVSGLGELGRKEPELFLPADERASARVVGNHARTGPILYVRDLPSSMRSGWDPVAPPGRRLAHRRPARAG